MDKPILFNTDMVKAILEGRKTVTRRIIKSKYENADITFFENKYGKRLVYIQNDVPGPVKNQDGTTTHQLTAMEEIKKPYNVGDVLWVRETWQEWTDGYAYKVGGNYPQSFIDKWKPSIHMPRSAARIFLKVTSVRAEKLQDITEEDAIKEGRNGIECKKEHDYTLDECCGYCNNSGYIEPPQLQFLYLWDSVYAKQSNGWSDNPWVWVIEFERV